jgi:hypothetical protein
MKLRSALLLATIGAAACSVGGITVSLGGDQALSSSGSGGDGTLGRSGAAGYTLNVDSGPIDVVCDPGKTTSISGTVYDPAGSTRLYNAVVYVAADPGPLPPFKAGVACEYCTDSVPAKAVALSGPDGHFVLEGVPAGEVDIVVQLGKWRRKQTVMVTACQDNPLTDRNLTRLPRSQAEGDIPKIALSTGHSDALECLLRKIGIADSEFTTDAGTGRVNMFVGCINDDGTRFGANKFAADLNGGAAFPSTNELFDSGELSQYDAVIFSCEGHRCSTIQTDTNVAKLVAFSDAGGRVFLDHDHYNWLNHAKTPIQKAAQFNGGPTNIPSPLTTSINTTDFPKGNAFAQWLLNEQASTTLGALTIYAAQTSVESLTPNRAQSWIYRTDSPTGFFYFTIGTPVAAADTDPAPTACGRVTFTDLHVSKTDGGDSSDFSDQDTPFPNGCTTTTLSAQEKALEFMLFDLTSCVQQESTTPTPPPK